VHTSETETWFSEDVLKAFALAVTEAMRDGAEGDAFIFTLCDVDLPAFVRNGTLYIQAPLPLVFDAFAAYISDGLSNLEARISEARSAALAPNRNGRTVHGAPVAE
jgi:hypothetical protein